MQNNLDLGPNSIRQNSNDTLCSSRSLKNSSTSSRLPIRRSQVKKCLSWGKLGYHKAPRERFSSGCAGLPLVRDISQTRNLRINLSVTPLKGVKGCPLALRREGDVNILIDSQRLKNGALAQYTVPMRQSLLAGDGAMRLLTRNRGAQNIALRKQSDFTTRLLYTAFIPDRSSTSMGMVCPEHNLALPAFIPALR